MKFSSSFALLTTASVASATSIRSANARASLMSKARKLEQNQADDAAMQDDFSFLGNYNLKLIGCAADEIYKNPETGESEYSSVVFRLCPADDCDDDTELGCKAGYGDYIVGINTFVESWLEDKQENMNGDDQFQIGEYSECKQYEVDQDADDANNGNQQAWYVGPTCQEEGGISLGFFSDYTCTTVPEDVTFEDISNGWSLPYSSGLVTTACEACAGYNDNGEYEVSEMCGQLWQNSGRCETEMEYVGYYGADESSCEFIESVMPAPAGGAGAAIGWAIFAVVVVGAAAYGYTKWWTAKKQGSSMASGGVLN